MQLANRFPRVLPLLLFLPLLASAACGDGGGMMVGEAGAGADTGASADALTPSPDLTPPDSGVGRDGDPSVKYDAPSAFAQATLTASPTAFSFPNTAIGSDSPPAKFVIANIGFETTGPVSHVTDGTHGSEFVITASTCGQPLAYQTTCEITLIFRPISAGAKLARLAVSATPGTSFFVLLNAAAVAPVSARIDPTVFDFPITPIATPAEPAPVPPVAVFTVTATGGALVGPLASQLTGANAADFAIAGNTCDGTVLSAGATCQISVRFKPTTPGAKVASLEVSAGALRLPVVTLAGVAAQPARLSISPVDHSFGMLPVGYRTVYTFEVKNEGGADAGKLSFSLEGMNFSEWSFVPDPACAELLKPEFVCNVVATFAPTTPGPKTASLRVTASPGGLARATFTATAITTGDPGTLKLTSPAPDPFGTIAVGESVTGTFVVENIGVAATGKLTATISGSGQNEFTVASNSCPDMIQPGALCPITVRFAPQLAGRRTANLQVSALPGGFATLPLSGNASAPPMLRVSHASRNFGTRNVGSTTMTPLDFTFSLVGASAMTGPLTVVVTGTDATSFQFAYDECQGVILQPGRTTCRVGVRLVPVSAGYKTATLTASANPGGTVSAMMYGTGN